MSRARSRKAVQQEEEETEEEDEEEEDMRGQKGRAQQRQRASNGASTSGRGDMQQQRGTAAAAGRRREDPQGRSRNGMHDAGGARAGIGRRGTGPEVDAYGFKLKLSAVQRADRQACMQAAAARAGDWEFVGPYLEGQGGLPRAGKLKKLVRKGVPAAYRGPVWMAVSGAGAQASSHPGLFRRLYKSASKSPSLKQIKLDLPRTFPGHEWVQSEEGQLMLKRVLVAFSLHNPQVGYCQGLNNVAAFLLLCTEKDEEASFWLLSNLVNERLYPQTYASSLLGCHVEMRTLGALVASKLPRLHAHLQTLECDPAVFSTDWFLCLFCTSLPAESAARVWDALFNEGAKILFRVGLALLQMLETFLLECDNTGDLLVTIKSATSSLHNHDKLMKVAFDGIGGFPMDKINKQRALHQVEVQRMVAEREARLREEQNRKELKRRMDDEQRRRDEEAEKMMEEEIQEDRWLPQLDNVFNMAKRMVQGKGAGDVARASSSAASESRSRDGRRRRAQDSEEEDEEEEDEEEEEGLKEREAERRRKETRERLEAMRRKREARIEGTWNEEEEDIYHPGDVAQNAAHALKGGATQLSKGVVVVASKGTEVVTQGVTTVGKGIGMVASKGLGAVIGGGKMLVDAAAAGFPMPQDGAGGSGRGPRRTGKEARGAGSEEGTEEEEEEEKDEEEEEEEEEEPVRRPARPSRPPQPAASPPPRAVGRQARPTRTAS